MLLLVRGLPHRLLPRPRRVRPRPAWRVHMRRPGGVDRSPMRRAGDPVVRGRPVVRLVCVLSGVQRWPPVAHRRVPAACLPPTPGVSGGGGGTGARLQHLRLQRRAMPDLHGRHQRPVLEPLQRRVLRVLRWHSHLPGRHPAVRRGLRGLRRLDLRPLPARQRRHVCGVHRQPGAARVPLRHNPVWPAASGGLAVRRLLGGHLRRVPAAEHGVLE